jgi:polyphosphate kinase 2 (PPK2 family)
MVIFNRSHHESVLVEVHTLRPREVWKRRYDQINVSKIVARSGTIVPVPARISKAEQKRRAA